MWQITKMRFVGDIHGEIDVYEQILSTCTESVQVGDFGMGFLGESQQKCVEELQKDGKHQFIRGNHDDPALCDKAVGWIPDGSITNGVMYVGGAWSIDWQFRVPGVSWWHDEEISGSHWQIIREAYLESKPRVMVTHDCPSSISWELFLKPNGKQIQNRTSFELEDMFKEHQPDLWVFGHWHRNRDQAINGTRFVCVANNDYIDLDMQEIFNA